MAKKKNEEHVRYVLTVRLNKKEHQNLKDMASDLNLTISETLRFFILVADENKFTLDADDTTSLKSRVSRSFGYSTHTPL